MALTGVTVLIHDALAAMIAILVAVLVLDASLSVGDVFVSVSIEDMTGAFYFVVVRVVVDDVAMSRVEVAVVVQDSGLPQMNGASVKSSTQLEAAPRRPRYRPRFLDSL